MKLLVIYGPPASGKLTVATEIAKKTDFKVFDNHKSIDIYKVVLPFGTDLFWKNVNNLRLEIFRLATLNDVNLIFTYCYEKDDDQLVKRIVKTVETGGGEVLFAQLTCEKAELFKRVEHDSRKKFGKLKSTEALKKSISDHNYGDKVSDYDSIVVENSHDKPEKTAAEIIELLSLL